MLKITRGTLYNYTKSGKIKFSVFKPCHIDAYTFYSSCICIYFFICIDIYTYHNENINIYVFHNHNHIFYRFTD
jgi:hypothetical protein